MTVCVNGDGCLAGQPLIMPLQNGLRGKGPHWRYRAPAP
jgi:hypothetical protein